MFYVLHVLGEDLMGHGIGGEVTQVSIDKSLFRFSLRQIEEPERNIPAVGTLVVGQVLFSNDAVCHEVAVEKILAVFFDKTENAGGNQRAVGKDLIAQVHVGHGTPCKGNGRSKYKPD